MSGWPFEYITPGTPINKPDCDTFNTLFRILNEITGENCWIEKTPDGHDWTIKLDIPAIGDALGIDDILPAQTEDTLNMVLMSAGEDGEAWSWVTPEMLMTAEVNPYTGELGGDIIGMVPVAGNIPVFAEVEGTPIFDQKNISDVLLMMDEYLHGVTESDILTGGNLRVAASGYSDDASMWLPLFRSDVTAEVGNVVLLNHPDGQSLFVSAPIEDVVGDLISDAIGSGTAGQLAKWKSDGTLETGPMASRLPLAEGDADGLTEHCLPVFNSATDYGFDQLRLEALLVDELRSGIGHDDNNVGGVNAEPHILTFRAAEDGANPGQFLRYAEWLRLIDHDFDGSEDGQLLMVTLTGSGTALLPYTARITPCGQTLEEIVAGALPTPEGEADAVLWYDFSEEEWTTEAMGDAFNASFGTVAGTVADGSHVSDTDNPHGVTPAQIGACLSSDFLTLNWAFGAHQTNTNNPHGVTVAQTGGYDTTYIDEALALCAEKYGATWTEDADDYLIAAVWDTSTTKLKLKPTVIHKSRVVMTDDALAGSGNLVVCGTTAASIDASGLDITAIPYLTEMSEGEIAAAGIPLLNGRKMESAFDFALSSTDMSGQSDTVKDMTLATVGWVEGNSTGLEGISDNSSATTWPRVVTKASDGTMQWDQLNCMPDELFSGNRGFADTDIAVWRYDSSREICMLGWMPREYMGSVKSCTTDATAMSQIPGATVPIFVKDYDLYEDGRKFDVLSEFFGVCGGGASLGNSSKDLVTQDYVDNWYPHFESLDCNPGTTNHIALWSGSKALKCSAYSIDDLTGPMSGGSTYQVWQKKSDGTYGFDYVRSHA